MARSVVVAVSSLVLLWGVVFCSPHSEPTCLFWDDQSDTYSMRKCEKYTDVDAVASGSFRDEVKEKGWGFLEVRANEGYSDAQMAYGVGYLEGSLSFRKIYEHWVNIVNGTTISPKVKEYLQKNHQWMNAMMHDFGNSSEYWYQVVLVFEQLQGLVDGYNSVAGSHQQLTWDDIYLFNIGGDLEDLSALDGELPLQASRGLGRCSGLVKVAADLSEIYAGQVTWGPYNSLLRVYKYYDIPYSRLGPGTERVSARSAAFSSSPALLMSGDDYYLLSNGMVALETTIGNNNVTLYEKYLKPEGSVLEWVRNLVANRLGRNGSEWASVFSRYNSGTYNNQWLLLDYRLFEPGKALKPNTLWALEQLPGYVVARDVTAETLGSTTYFGSYNTAYFKEIFEVGGWPDLVAKYGGCSEEGVGGGCWFTYDHTARANIFRRDQGTIDHGGMSAAQRLMRYNNFQHDPCSKCDYLNPANGTYPFPALSFRNHGGTDVKITNSQMYHDGRKSWIIAGPTYDQQPVFVWSESPFWHLPHEGMPDRLDWKWMETPAYGN